MTAAAEEAMELVGIKPTKAQYLVLIARPVITAASSLMKGSVHD